jgi:hypothetical protein
VRRTLQILERPSLLSSRIIGNYPQETGTDAPVRLDVDKSSSHHLSQNELVIISVIDSYPEASQFPPTALIRRCCR